MCKYTKIKGLDSRAKEQKRDERGASFQSSPKINCMLITTRLHTMKVYNTRPVCLSIDVLLIKILLFSTTEVFSRFEVINAFVDLPAPEKLDILLINFSEAFFTKKHGPLKNFSVLSVTRSVRCSRLSLTSRCLSPVSTVSARNAWDHDFPFGAHTRKQKESKLD